MARNVPANGNGGAETAVELPYQQVGGYQLLEVIGQGGMGHVYKAQAPDGQIVALKVLGQHLASREVERTRFYREARAAMLLNHPNLVRALGFGDEQGRHYFVMEYVDGENLSQYLTRVGQLSESEAIRLIVEVARGLESAHQQGLVHRDVKPDNILITRAGNVKLVDLGLVKELDTDLLLTQPDRGLGTPAFMAPEQFRDAQHSDARADIYALGQTLYIMVTGELPFPATGSMVDTFLKKNSNDYRPPHWAVPTLRRSTSAAICQAMEGDPDRRPSSVGEFLDLLLGRTAPLAAPPSEIEIDAADRETERPRAGRSELPDDADSPPVRGLTESYEDLPALFGKASRSHPCTAVGDEFSAHLLLWLDRPALFLTLGIVSISIIALIIGLKTI